MTRIYNSLENSAKKLYYFQNCTGNASVFQVKIDQAPHGTSNFDHRLCDSWSIFTWNALGNTHEQAIINRGLYCNIYYISPWSGILYIIPFCSNSIVLNQKKDIYRYTAFISVGNRIIWIPLSSLPSACRHQYLDSPEYM